MFLVGYVTRDSAEIKKVKHVYMRSMRSETSTVSQLKWRQNLNPFKYDIRNSS